MLSTPDLSHLSHSDYEKVYEPAEDSFLFMDALEKDIQRIRDMRPLCIGEVGTGSGCLITFLAKHLQIPSRFLLLLIKDFIGIDLNGHATKYSKQTAVKNSCDIDFVQGCFTFGFRAAAFDVLLCNPPYVPTPYVELGRQDLYASWAGGLKGLSMTDKLLGNLPVFSS